MFLLLRLGETVRATMWVWAEYLCPGVTENVCLAWGLNCFRRDSIEAFTLLTICCAVRYVRLCCSTKRCANSMVDYSSWCYSMKLNVHFALGRFNKNQLGRFNDRLFVGFSFVHSLRTVEAFSKQSNELRWLSNSEESRLRRAWLRRAAQKSW